MSDIVVDAIKDEDVKQFFVDNSDLDLVSLDLYGKDSSRKPAAASKPKRSGTRSVTAAVSAPAPAGAQSADVTAKLLAYQRMVRLTGDMALAEKLLDLGLDSSAKIAALSPANFVEQTRAAFKGDEAAALDVHARAGHIKTAAHLLYGSVKDLVASPFYRSAQFNVAAQTGLQDYFRDIPSYTELFGNMNYLSVDPGQTIFSAAAYLFDVMRIIDQYITLPNTSPVRTIPPHYTLEERRPDLFTLELTPANTFGEFPYLALVNGVLAQSIVQRGVADAYQYLALAPYPFDLPYNLPLFQLRRQLDAMTVSLAAIYRAMAVARTDPDAVAALDAARETIGLSVTELARWTKADPGVDAVTRQYGYDIPRTPPPFTGTGVIGQLANGTAIAGVGTRFTAQLALGDQIQIGAQTRTVAAIASDTALTLDSALPTATALPYIVVANAAPPVPVDGKGTIAINPDDGTVTGTDTSFLTQVAPGATITAAKQTRTVTAVTSDVQLTVSAPWPFISDGLAYKVLPSATPPPPYTGPGALIYQSGSATVAGIDTQFATAFANGGKLQVGSVTVAVANVASATSLTVATPWPTDGGTGYSVQPKQRTGTVVDALPAAGTGTIAFAKDSASVTGTGTSFTSELNPGDQISAAGIIRTVVHVVSNTQIEIDGSPGVDATGQAFTILHSDGLDLSEIFIQRTGLTRDQLTALLCQDLDDGELAAGGAATFFINDTGETPASITLAMSNDPANPTYRLQGLTLKRLDRIGRFVRLASTIGWSFADLQWAMTATGATEITNDLVMDLSRIAALLGTGDATVTDITALFFAMKTSGRVTPGSPQDQFDRIYNAPALLQGADPYAAGSTVPFNPARSPAQTWTIANAGGDDGVIRARLRAALQVNDRDLTRLAVCVQYLTAASGSDSLKLTLVNLTWLYRLSALAARLDWTIDDLLTFLGLLYYPSAPNYFTPPARALSLSLDGLANLFAMADWVNASGYSVSDLQYIVTATPPAGYALPYDPSGIAEFMADVAASAAPTHLSATDFNPLSLNPTQQGLLLASLVTAKIVTALGIFQTYAVAYDDVRGLLPIRESDQVAGFDKASFVTATNGITAEESGKVYDALRAATPAILVVPGQGTAAVAESFGAATDLAFLTPIFTTDPAAKVASVRGLLLTTRQDIGALRDLLNQKIGLQQTSLTRALATFLGSSAATVGALIPIASTLAPLPDYLSVFLTPLAAGAAPPAPATKFIDILARIGLIAANARLDSVELGYATSAAGAAHFNIGSWAALTIGDVRNIGLYAALRGSVGATADQLIAYFQTPADDKQNVGRKTAALAAATGWSATDIDLLKAYFWPAPAADGADTILGLTRLSGMFDLERKLGVDAATIRKLTATAHLSIESAPGVIDPAHWGVYQDLARIGRGIVNAAFTGDARAAANTAIDSAVNARSRDALVGNVLWWMNARDASIRDINSLYQYLLLDLEMGACFTTSPIAQAISSTQLYMQRCRMMQEPGVLTVPIPKIWWSWLTNYRIWEANRRIFVYPENYIEPSLRQNATPQFRDLSDDLLQNDPTKANVAKPFEKFINALTELGALAPVGAYQAVRLDQRSGDSVDSAFLIGRTRTQPYQYYFRTLDDATDWQPWQAIDLSISADRISPVYAFGRLFVFWVEFEVGKSNSIADQASKTETSEKATIKYAFYNNGEWTTAQSLQKALINTYPSTYSVITGPGPVATLLQRENSYWQFPFVISTGQGMVGGGRVSLSAGMGVVDGTATRFKSEVRAGDTIACFGEQRVVGAVASDTELVVTVPWDAAVDNAEYKIIPVSREGRFRPFPGTGTASTTATMPLVSGTGTRFLDEFAYGDSIQIGDEVHLIILIQDQENILVDQPWIGSYGNSPYDVLPGRQGEENILVCYGPPFDTKTVIDIKSKVQTDNPTKNSFITEQNALNLSVYESLWLAAQYRPTAQNIAGDVPLSTCTFLDANLSLSNAKVLLTDYQYAASANPQPFRGALIRDYARLSVEPSSNILYDAYWSTNLPGLNDSRRPENPSSIGLLYNIAAQASSLIPVGNKPGSFLFDNVDEGFLVRPDNGGQINLVTDIILRSRRPWKPDLLDSQILSTSAYVVTPEPLTATKFSFVRLGTHAMPTLQQRLFAGGVDNLLQLDSQYLFELPFNRFYQPPAVSPPTNVVAPLPRMDFDGAFGLYFWETFFHTPFLIADRLNGNGKFEDALAWLEYIFNPTQQPDEHDEPDSASRFWRFRPFREMDQQSLAADLTDSKQIKAYNDDPFDPDAIARIRQVAYAKTIVMHYVDVVLDWADSLFAQYTRETITQATNLYVFAEQLLGSKPRSLGKMPLPEPKNFNQLKANYHGQALPQFLIDLENTPYLVPRPDNERYDSQPVNDIIAYFAVPENSDFMAYWDRVEDRLYKIRNCMNIDGQIVPLALFEPPIDPALLIQAAAAGQGNALAGLFPQGVPFFRFSYLVEQAKGLCNQLAGLNANLLSALEKKDAEALSLLLNQQEAVLLKLTTDIKNQEIIDTQSGLTALQQGLASAQARVTHYQNLINTGLLPHEQKSLDAMLAALVFNTLGTYTKTASSIGYAVPQVGSPFAMTYGGEQIGNALSAAAGVFEIGAAISTFISQQTQTLASYERRAEDWALQLTLGQYDVAQISAQIAGNQARLLIAQQNLAVHLATISQNQDKAAFFKDKFTNAKLYQWLANQLSRVQFQTYTLAYQLAQMAQRSYQFENGTDRSFIQFDYWNATQKGLGSADGLLLALSQMEASALEFPRSLEITRTVSLMQIDPVALIKLRETGECYFDFTERMFDFDFPGQYNRKIQSLSVSIPCVVGPYQNIKAVLTQLGNQVVLKTGDAGLNAVNFLLDPSAAAPPPPDALRSNWRNFQQIALSRGQDDTGMFSSGPNDPQYLPFEGTGAVSSWRLSLPMGTNRIAFDAISDVLVTINYTAKDGGDAFRGKVAGLPALKSYLGSEYITCRSMYFDAWQAFMSEVAPGAKTQTLSLPIADFVPPHVTGAKLIAFALLLSADAAAGGSYITVQLTKTLSAEPTLSPDNETNYRFSEHGQAAPTVAKVVADPIQIIFDLDKTPGVLKKPVGETGLDPAALKDISFVFFYSGNVDL